MDRNTEKLINRARVCLANHNYEELLRVTKHLDLDVLSGTVFDKNINLSYEELNNIVNELKSRRKIKNISNLNYQSMINKEPLNLSTGELNATFDTIERNLKLFNDKFNGKVFRIDSSYGEKDLVAIGVCNFFHLLGFDLKKWSKYDKSILRIFPEFKELLNREYRDICINDDTVLFDALYSLLDKKNKVIYELTNKNSDLNDALNMNKVKIKNFLFERGDFTASPSGIVRHSPKGGNIKGDFYLIRDHINRNSVEWGVSSFRAYDELPPKKLESLLFNYFESNEMSCFQKEITTSVGCIDKLDYMDNPEIDQIPIMTSFDANELEYFRRILCGFNPIIEPKVKKKQTK